MTTETTQIDLDTWNLRVKKERADVLRRLSEVRAEAAELERQLSALNGATNLLSVMKAEASHSPEPAPTAEEAADVPSQPEAPSEASA